MTKERSEVTYATYFHRPLLGKAVPSLSRFQGRGRRHP